jgi:DNA helicase-2/ATP-dependent DNA helicase PcrA
MPFPSKEQKSVIDFTGPRLVVVAPPGTGKTRTIVERMIRLLQEDASREISFITFTRTSRRDTRRKVESALAKKLDELSKTQLPSLSTLHTYAKAFVHRFSHLIGSPANFSVLIDGKGEKNLVLEELLSDTKVDLDLKKLRIGLTCLRSTGSWPDDFPASISDRMIVREHYDRLLSFYSTLDLEGLVTRAIDIIEKSDKAVPIIYLQVDEYQDLNPKDQMLIKLLASNPKSQVVVVGDDAQSIYGFRHADYGGLRELFESNDWKNIRFSNSHRLPIHIQNTARLLVAEEDYLGTLQEATQPIVQKIVIYECTKPNYQIGVVAKTIIELVANRKKNAGNSLTYKDFLVLCPTKDQVEEMSATLEKKFDLPTRRISKPSIPEDHWRLLLVLRMVHYLDSLAFRQWLTISGLNLAEVTALRRSALAIGKTLYSYCDSVEDERISGIYLALEKIRATLDDFVGFQQALLEFPNLLVESDLFPEVGLTIDQATTRVRSIGEVIQSIYEKFGLIDAEEDIPEEDKILVTTLHSAKGLEAEFVFVCWMNSRYMPMSNRDEREEKRVLYVALTRAKQDVILTFHEEWDTQKSRRLCSEAMSPFLREIVDLLDIRKVSAKDLS